MPSGHQSCSPLLTSCLLFGHLLLDALGVPLALEVALVAGDTASCAIPVLATALSPGGYTLSCACRSCCSRSRSCCSSSRCSCCSRHGGSCDWRRIRASTRAALATWPLAGGYVGASFSALRIRRAQ